MPIANIIPAILLSAAMVAPMAAQSPLLGSSCRLVYVGEPSGSLYEGLQALLMTDELGEMGIRLYAIQATSSDYAQIASQVKLAPDSLWALAISDNNSWMLSGDRIRSSLAQGNELPSAADVRNVLDAAGIKSPISALRDFLKQHPNHLDARAHLLNQLLQIAEARTCHALRLDNKSIDDLVNEQNLEAGFEPEMLYFR